MSQCCLLRRAGLALPGQPVPEIEVLTAIGGVSVSARTDRSPLPWLAPPLRSRGSRKGLPLAINVGHGPSSTGLPVCCGRVTGPLELIHPLCEPEPHDVGVEDTTA
jgi:hypothetical protein